MREGINQPASGSEKVPALTLTQDHIERMRSLSGTGAGASEEEVLEGYKSAHAEQKKHGVNLNDNLIFPLGTSDQMIDDLIEARLTGTEYEPVAVEAPTEITPDQLERLAAKWGLDDSSEAAVSQYYRDNEPFSRLKGQSLIDAAPRDIPTDFITSWDPAIH